MSARFYEDDDALFNQLLKKKAQVLQTFQNSDPAEFVVFIGNLSWKVKEAEVRKFFEKCGNIWSVKISTHAQSGVRKGFAHVEFEDKEAVENALQFHNRLLGDRKVTVARAAPKPVSVQSAGLTPRGKLGPESEISEISLALIAAAHEGETKQEPQADGASQGKKRKRKRKKRAEEE